MSIRRVKVNENVLKEIKSNMKIITKLIKIRGASSKKNRIRRKKIKQICTVLLMKAVLNERDF